MATVDTTFLRQRPFPKLEVGSGLRSMLKSIRVNADEFIEYPPCGGKPGSIKGENGWWRLTEWAEYRIDQTLKKRGERV